MLTTDINGYPVKESSYKPPTLESKAFGAGKIRAIDGGAPLTVKQLASRLRVSSVKAAGLIAIAQDGFDSIKAEIE